MTATTGRSWRWRVMCRIAVVLAVIMIVLADQPVASPAAATGGPAATTALVPVTPCRLFDSRSIGRPLVGGATHQIDVAGRCGVPRRVGAVAVTITAVEPSAPGHVTAWGEGRVPETSDVNMEPSRAVANAAIVPVGADGRVRVRPSASTHLLVDVSGAFVPAETASAGRFVPIEPVRVLDTRAAGTVPSGRSTVPGEAVRAPLPRGVPADAVAVAATVTVVGARSPGYVTAHAAGTPRTEASISNLVAGETRAAGVIVPVSAAGASVHTTTGGHVLVDVTGWFTGPSAGPGSDGLYVPVEPVRVHDSRKGRRTLGSGGVREITSVVRGAGSAAAWAVNLTAVRARSSGYVTVFPARTARPATSALNVPAGATVSNSTFVGLSRHGLAGYVSASLDLIVDLRGWFTGEPVPATTGPAPDRRAPQRVLVVSDSAFAGMRWNRGATDLLIGAEFHVDLESCRRLVAPSCVGREGYAPHTALQAIERWPAWELDTVVMAVGYNDRLGGFADHVDHVVTAARDRGVRTIVWMALREQVGYRPPGSAAHDYPWMNLVLRERAAGWVERGGPRLVVLEWGDYTAHQHGWLRSDGVHATRMGAHGQADTIARAVAAVDAAPCPMPLAPGLEPADPCPLPGSPDALVLPDLLGLYGPSVLVDP